MDSSHVFGLALSGGALRGAAHIGVIEVLLENGFEPAIISGTSAGSVVGALVAHGLSAETLRSLVRNFPGRKLVDWQFNAGDVLLLLWNVLLRNVGMRRPIQRLLPAGFIRGDELEKYVRKLLRLTPTRKPIPMAIIATPIHSLRAVAFTNAQLRADVDEVEFLPLSDVAAAVRASCSIPGIFSPRRIEDRLYMDGALADNVPADVLHLLGYEKVIAVDLHRTELEGEVTNFTQVIDHAIDILVERNTRHRLDNTKAFMLRPKLPDVGLTDFEQIEACVRIGRRAAEAALPDIRRYLDGSMAKTENVTATRTTRVRVK